MTRALYLVDSYQKECDAAVVAEEEGSVVLDQTIFYPKGGGQPSDTGQILKNENEVFTVISVKKLAGEISHTVDITGLRRGDSVHCILDWERRYKLMRSHTAAHVFASLLFKGTGALVTGNQLDEEKIRFDFSLEKYNREILCKYLDKANELFKGDIPVIWYELPRQEALKIPGVIKMAKALPPNISKLRIVEIEGIDQQADGGTHVRNLSEIGQIVLLKTENKGKHNRRVYFKLEKIESHLQYSV